MSYKVFEILYILFSQKETNHEKFIFKNQIELNFPGFLVSVRFKRFVKHEIKKQNVFFFNYK